MKLSLNGATTMRADLATDIEAASSAGFEIIEIWAAKLRQYLSSHSIGDLRALLKEKGIAPYSINSIERITFRNADDAARMRNECRELCAIAEQIGCPYIVVVPGPKPEAVTDNEIKDESVRVLRELSEIARRHQVDLAFEFLGFADCVVSTLDLCWEIVRSTDRDNIGLVLDSFHFYAGGSSFESIDRLDPNRLFIFHINDVEDRPRDQLQDAHRLLPGKGILPLTEIISRLKAIGYDRVASIELFRPEYWQWDPVTLAQRARQATEAVLQRA